LSRIQEMKRQLSLAMQQSDWEEALSILGKMVGQDAQPAYFNQLGDIYLKTGRRDEAISSFMEGVKGYRSLGMYPNGAALCKKVLRLEPEHREAVWLLGELKSRQGFLADGAEGMLEALQDYAEDPSADRDEIARMLGEIEQLHAANMKVLEYAATAYAQAGEMDQARSVTLRIADLVEEREGNAERAQQLREAAEHLKPGVEPDLGTVADAPADADAARDVTAEAAGIVDDAAPERDGAPPTGDASAPETASEAPTAEAPAAEPAADEAKERGTSLERALEDTGPFAGGMPGIPEAGAGSLSMAGGIPGLSDSLGSGARVWDVTGTPAVADEASDAATLDVPDAEADEAAGENAPEAQDHSREADRDPESGPRDEAAPPDGGEYASDDDELERDAAEIERDAAEFARDAAEFAHAGEESAREDDSVAIVADALEEAAEAAAGEAAVESEAAASGEEDSAEDEAANGETAGVTLVQDDDDFLLRSTIDETIESADEVIDEAVAGAPLGPAFEPGGEAAEEHAFEPGGEAVEEPAFEPGGEAAEEPAFEPVGEAAEEPAFEPVGEAAEEPAFEPGGGAAEEPAFEPGGEAAEEPAFEPGGGAAEEPAFEPGGEAVGEPADEERDAAAAERDAPPADETFVPDGFAEAPAVSDLGVGGGEATEEGGEKVWEIDEVEARLSEIEALDLSHLDSAADDDEPVPDDAGDSPRQVERVLGEFRERMEEQLGPMDLEERYQLGVAYMEMGLHEEALAEFDQILKHSFVSPKTRELMARCLLALGRADEVLPLLESVLNDEPHPRRSSIELYYLLGEAYEIMGQKDHALDSFTKVYQLEPDFRDVQRKLENLTISR